MRQLIRNFAISSTLNNVRRCFQSSVIKSAYEGDGKTTVSFLSRDPFYGLMIKSVNHWGFTLNTGVNVLGSMIIFPKTILSWKVASASKITEDSLSIFKYLEPKLDIVVIGLDTSTNPMLPQVQLIRKFLQEAKIGHEILPTEKAVAVFNFLNSDQRYVAAALIPPGNATAVVTKTFRSSLKHDDENDKI